MNVEELMQYMIAFFENTDKNLSAKYDELGMKDKEICDVLHYIEIHNLNAAQYAKTGKLLQQVRRERRQIKYDIEMLETIKRFTDKYNAKLITGDIVKNLKLQRELKKKQDNPTYKYRTNILEKIDVKLTNEK